MSGGVDSAVAALRADGEVVAVTLELWRDPENDGERSCCSADAVRGARALAHRMGLAAPHARPARGLRAGVVDPWLGGHAAGQTRTRVSAATARSASTRCWTWPTASGRRR
jgi:tRNA-specific 2-thiouridylase